MSTQKGLQECKKILTLAKAGKMNGCLIEGMGCPGGCIAGAGTNIPVPKAKKDLAAYREEFKQVDSAERTGRD